MHIEVQVALNFVISYLYNKLPRRRVNIFGEELEKALKDKFQGHWYPDKPFKGSAFRCFKTGDPVDKVLIIAARESGVPIQDILENLPQELAVWVDPGEVSYRIGEKGAVKILFSEKVDPQEDHSADREVTKTFNPEAQCFRPIESVGCSLSNLTISSPKSVTPFNSGGQNGPQLQQQLQHQQQQVVASTQVNNNNNNVVMQAPPASNLNAQQPTAAPNALSHHVINMASPTAAGAAPSPTSLANSYKGSPTPGPAFIPRTTTPLTFTTASFAQTKFGSTKLKTNSKRVNRMSPTEFSNYIKQRAAMQQQIHQQSPHQNGRALSPDPSSYYYGHGPYGPQFQQRSMFESSSQQFLSPDLYPANNAAAAAATKLPFETPAPFYQNNPQVSAAAAAAGAPQASSAAAAPQDKILDSWPYASAPNGGQYQHLLVAN